MQALSKTLVVCLSLLSLGGCASGPPHSETAIDATVERAMQAFSVPGVAVGVIKDGRILHAKGYGIRELGEPERIDGQTLFRVASNSKAMTTAALAMLVDQELLAWDDKIVNHIPDFRLHDPWITREFNVVDLLTHRSGLGLGAGDLMLWPRPNSFTREDIIHGLRYFEAQSGFRTEYAYDNTLYIVAGELIPAVSGTSWEDYVDSALLGPLGLERCFAGDIPAGEMTNLAAPHALVEGELSIVERNRISAETSVSAAAGGVRCSLDDMLVWMSLQLNRGVDANGVRYYSDAQAETMWSPKTIRSVSERDRERDGTHFKAYGLGWRLADIHGYKEVAHTGTFTGWGSNLVLIPELDLGVIVLTNGGQTGPARAAIANSIVRPYMGVRGVDWIAEYTPESGATADADFDLLAAALDGRRAARPLADYSATYRDPWFGEVRVYEEGGQLWFASVKSPRMRGELWPWEGNTFVVRWADRSLQADAFVHFDIDTAGVIDGMTMEPVSAETDWSFNYGDLNFERIARTER
ncbi:MAG: serine hydrolase [Pseudomonadota bacterium]